MNTKKGKKKEAIYNAVCTLWQREQSLDALTVQRIAQEAGIGKGTVYEYFTSREEILAQTIANEMQRCTDAACGAVDGAQGYEAKLRMLLDIAEEFLRLQTVGIQALSAYLQGGNQLAPLCDSIGWEALSGREDAVLRSVLHAAEQEGRARGDLSEERRLLALRSLLYGYVTARRRTPEKPAEERKADTLALLHQLLG